MKTTVSGNIRPPLSRDQKGSFVRLPVIALLLLFLMTVMSVGFPAKVSAEPSVQTALGGPPPPTGLSAVYREEDRGLRVTLSWNHLPECTGGYRVYRSTILGGPYEEVGGISSSTFIDYPFFLDDTVKCGIKYYYKVSSINDQWQEGPMSDPVTATPPRYFRIASVQKSMVVSLADQLVYCYENGVVVNILRCSTGASGTPTGNYRIYAHHPVMPSGSCVCNYWMDWKPGYGMHSWPRWSDGYRDYEENLGVTPRSHGCIRLHPLEAYWPYNWAPDGTPLTIVPYSIGKLPFKGTHSCAGSPELAKSWYFAEGYSSAEFLEYLLFFNPGEEKAVATTTYYPEGKPPVVEAYTIEPKARETIAVNNVSSLSQPSGHGIVINSNKEIIVQQSHYFNYGGRRGGHTSTGINEPATKWYFAEGFTGALFDTYLLLFNPGDKAAKVDIEYMAEGEAPRVISHEIPTKTRSTLLINALPEAAGKSLSMIVSSTTPVVAQRSEYFAWPGNPNGINGGNTGHGTSEPGKTWYLADGCTEHFYDEYILILNPNFEPANVSVVFCPATGPFGQQYALAPKSRGTIAVDSIPGLESADTPAFITSDKDIVVEKTMFNARDSRRGGDLASGVTTLSKDWYFAEGYTGGTFDEYLLLFNPSDQAITANIYFHPENANITGASYSIPPKRKLAVHVDEIPGVEWNSSGVEIHADQPIAAEQSHTFCIPR